MALLGFQSRFVALIERGEKTHTIRYTRPDITVGKRLDLYAHPRRKDMRLIFRAPCLRIEGIQIVPSDPAGEVYLPERVAVAINGVWLDAEERRLFARRDGFNNFADMCMFWNVHRELPFEGAVIHWDFAKRGIDK